MRAARVLLRLGVLAIGVHSLVTIGGAPSQLLSPGALFDASGRRRPEADRWLVEIDGWYIEVNGIVAEPPVDWQEHYGDDVPTPYAHLVGKYAESVGLDWRFVLAVMFEESRFQPDQESEAGAYGLMQVRPIAARDVGEPRFREPEANIRTGVRYLERLQEMFAAAQGRNRLALVLAAYNMGPSHVHDAQQLARNFGYNPLVWDQSMEVVIPLLEDPRIFEDLANGFAQGRKVVAYVGRVLERFDAYRRLLPSVPPNDAVTVSAIDPRRFASESSSERR